ncbi:MAG: YjgP/YjgQ family permease [Planctomycetes bacterium]|nr:YjgP/YjgQ family permease [Planctomycetota bacterium]
MRLLERYVLGELLRVFGILVTVSTSLLVFVGAFGQARDHGLGHWQILQILPFIVPSLLPYTVPATLLLTVCVVYGRMAGENEIIAAKAAGISIFNLMWPSFFLASLLSVTVLLFSDQVIPWAFNNITRIVTLAVEDIFLERLKTQSTFSVREKDRSITITVTGVRDRTLLEPVIRYTPKGGNAFTIRAREARLIFDLPKQQGWVELQGAQTSLPDRKISGYIENDGISFPLKSKNQRLRANELNIDDIRSEYQKLSESTEKIKQSQALEAAFVLSTGDFERLASEQFLSSQSELRTNASAMRRLRTEHYNRFAMACSCLFFVILGSPFSIHMARNQFLTSFLMCFLPILLVYYPVSMLMINLSKTGSVNPVWGVWIANGLIALASAFFLRLVTRN